MSHVFGLLLWAGLLVVGWVGGSLVRCLTRWPAGGWLSGGQLPVRWEGVKLLLSLAGWLAGLLEPVPFHSTLVTSFLLDREGGLGGLYSVYTFLPSFVSVQFLYMLALPSFFCLFTR